MYEEKQDAIIEALIQDLGRPRQETIAVELEFLKNDVRNLVRNLREWLKPTKPRREFIFFFDSAEVHMDPYGVVLIIGAWNYPFRSCLLPMASAIAAGNTIIVKPSEKAPASAELIRNLISEYLDTCYQVFLADEQNFAALLRERFDYIFYSGEPHIGKLVHTAACKHLTPTTLVMGGKNPVYVDKTADMDMTARRILWGKCMNSGQTCIGPEYVLCTKSVQEKFIEACKKALSEFYRDNPKESADFGRIVSDHNFQKLIKHLSDGKIALGGVHDEKEKYVAPTILVDVNPNSNIMEEEIYGPILPIINVTDVKEAVEFINAREKPLSLYVFSNLKNDVDHLLEKTSSGGVTVNDTLMHVYCHALPFGGVGQSGIGAYHGKYTFDTFVHKKSVFKRPQSKILDKIERVRYPPYSDTKVKLMSLIIGRKRSFSFQFLKYVVVFLVGVGITLIILYFSHYI